MVTINLSQKRSAGQQATSLAQWGVAALAVSSGLVSKAAALPNFADLPKSGSLQTSGGAKTLPATMRPGFATLDLVAHAPRVVTATPSFYSTPGTWYGVSQPKGAVANVGHPGRRLLGLTPFGGGGTPPPGKTPPAPGKTPPVPATPPGKTPPSPTTPSCSTPTPTAPQPSPAGSSQVVTAQLTGCPTADYSAPVNVGGQSALAIADTGSTTFGIVSNKCSDCGTPSSYKPGSSSKDDNTKIEADYGRGKWFGELTTDAVSFGGGPTATIKFGAIYDQQDWVSGNNCDLTANKPGAPINSAIMGLGGPSLLIDGTDSWIEKTNSSLAYPAVTFGLCDLNGAMYLGGFPQNNAASDVIYTPMATPKQSPYVAVAMQGMSVGDTDIGATLNDFGYTVVDTGSTAIIFPPAVYQAIAQGIDTATQGAITQDFFDTGDCLQLSGTTISDLNNQAPPLQFDFYNAANSSTVNTLTNPATNSYLLAQSDGSGGLIVCPLLVNSGADNPITLLGNTIMRGFLTIFDYKKDQVGFAVSQNVCKSN